MDDKEVKMLTWVTFSDENSECRNPKDSYATFIVVGLGET